VFSNSYLCSLSFSPVIDIYVLQFTFCSLVMQKVSSSSAKQKESGVNREKEQPAKRLKSPAGPMSPLIPARSTGIRMMLSNPRVSPRLMSPSTTLANSPLQPPTSTLKETILVMVSADVLFWYCFLCF
jgi:hypothetical protein